MINVKMCQTSVISTMIKYCSEKGLNELTFMTKCVRSQRL